MTDKKLTDLTAATTLAMTDIIYSVINPGTTPESRKATISALAASIKLDDLAAPENNTDLNASTTAHGLMPKLSGNSSDVFRGDGSWGSFGYPCNLRMSLSSASAIPTADITGGSVLYIHAFNGNMLALRDITASGSPYKILTHSGSSIALPATSGSMYDVFAYISSGSVAFETASTTRTANLPLDSYGIETKSGDVSRRYIGSFRTAASGKSEHTILNRFIFNAYNQMKEKIKVADTTGWTTNTGVWRQMRASTANQIGLLLGRQQLVDLKMITDVAAGSDGWYAGAFGLNLTASVSMDFYNLNFSTTRAAAFAIGELVVPSGYNYISMNEITSGATAAVTAASLIGEVWL